MYANTFTRKIGMASLAFGATLVTATLLQATIISSASAAEAASQRGRGAPQEQARTQGQAHDRACPPRAGGAASP